MKKISVFLLTSVLFLTLSLPVLAADGDVSKVETFIENVIQILVTIAGLVAAGFFVWGGIGYITSSGNPESLDRAKKTILYSAIGLTIVLGAFVITNIVNQTAGNAFGTN